MSISEINKLCMQLTGRGLPKEVKEGINEIDGLAEVIYNALKVYE